MKRFLGVLSCLLFISIANAQFGIENLEDRVQNLEEPAQDQLQIDEVQKTGSDNDTYKAGGDTIWYEDFGTGFPSGWSIQDSSGICPWTYSLDGTWGFFNSNSGTGPGIDTLQSATKSNGFLICDPDSANNAQYGQPSGSNYQYLSSYFTTSVIDLTGYPAVLLQFEHLFRFNNGIDLIVGVSADGTNWTNYFVQGNTSNNTQSANAETANLNISAVAGNQATVYVRIGWSARVYYWMIDDIRIVEAPANDLAVTMEQYYPFYKSTPIRQTTDITFTGAIANNGGNTQTNVELNATVTHLGDTTFNGSSTPMSSAPSALDTVTVLDSSYIPAWLGDYTLDYYVTYDSVDFNPNDDTLYNNFAVTDTVYARDNGNYTGWGVRTSTSGTKQRGILYDVWQQDTLTSISVLITGLTPASGQIMQFHIYDTTLLFPLASSAFHTIQASDLGNWVTLSIPELALPPGQYIAAVESFSDSVYVHFDPNAPPPLPQATFYMSSNGSWYYSSSYTYYVRMNTKRPPCNTSFVVTTTASTCDSSDAQASVAVSGGILPYTYSWNTNPVQTTDTAWALAAGIYTLTVNDGLGCVYTEAVSILDAGSATLSISSTDVSCAGAGDGTATITASGGTTPLTYSWSNGESDTLTSNLIGGVYNVTVQAADNCISAASVTILEPAGLNLSTSSTSDEMDNNANGSITTSASGGTGAYSYSWNTSPVQTSAMASGLVAGTYTGIVTDANGCQDSVTETIALIIGVEEEQLNTAFSIYPNPTTGLFHIQFANLKEETVSIELFNILGERVFMKTKEANDFFLNIGSLETGIYFLKARTSEGVFTQKVIKKN